MKATTLAELDAALANPRVSVINIASPAGVWINIGDTHGKEVSVSGSATIGYVSGSATIKSVYGSATIKSVSDSATIKSVSGSATIEYVSDSATIGYVSGSATIGYVSGSATIKSVYGSATIKYVYDSATIKSVYGSATIKYVYDSATIGYVYGSATIGSVSDSATIESVYGSATIGYVSGSATIGYVSGSATIKSVSGSATIKSVSDSATIAKAAGTAVIHSARDRARIKAGSYVTVYVYSATVTVEGGRVTDMTEVKEFEPTTWADLHGVEIVNGEAILFKAVNDRLESERRFPYPIGETVTAPDWGDTDECGNGLHVSPTPHSARRYYPTATRFLKIATPLEALRPISGSSNPKAKFQTGRVLAEVDLLGDEIK